MAYGIKKTTTREGHLYEGKECMILQTPGALMDTEAWIYNVLKDFEGKHIELTLTVEVKVIENVKEEKQT